jgi:predicted Zn-dependent protease
MKAFLAFLVLCLWALNSTAAQSNNSTGSFSGDLDEALSQMNKALSTANDELSPADEYFLGRAVGANLLSQYKTYTANGPLGEYLNSICSALTVNSPQPELYDGYHVLILDSPEINAFATPGGHIFITRGLIKAVESEDALAAVIAHEIAHIQLRHGITAVDNMKLTRELSAVADRAAKMAARDLSIQDRRLLFDNSVQGLVTTLLTNGYSQANEYEADAYALRLLALAGYSPSSLVDVLRVLDRNKSVGGGFYKTHPAPDQRIIRIQGELNKLPVRDTRVYRAPRYVGQGILTE